MVESIMKGSSQAECSCTALMETTTGISVQDLAVRLALVSDIPQLHNNLTLVRNCLGKWWQSMCKRRAFSHFWWRWLGNFPQHYSHLYQLLRWSSLWHLWWCSMRPGPICDWQWWNWRLLHGQTQITGQWSVEYFSEWSRILGKGWAQPNVLV